ncbi:MAG: hypothetical protein AAFP08_15370 [Bacteroidota bacterium]
MKLPLSFIALPLFWTLGLQTACEEVILEEPFEIEDYQGTASVSQGFATTTTSNLYAEGIRVAALGEITATDNSGWVVPAEVNYTDDSFPFAPDLYNPNGTQYVDAATALAAFDEADIIEIDADGELITAYVFADNYFEMYINGVPVGKDAIPFTDFNSHILQFRVKRPFTIAVKLVDWEENLGLGTESNQGSAYHPGDGGFVAAFHDANGNTVATTGAEWKAQCFYIAPIEDLTCPFESGTTRGTNCSMTAAADGSNAYALHWAIPANWTEASFDDSDWPDATSYSNNTVGVDNKVSYTRYADIFDEADDDAAFIWSTNLVLDNEVIVRFTVQ